MAGIACVMLWAALLGTSSTIELPMCGHAWPKRLGWTKMSRSAASVTHAVHARLPCKLETIHGENIPNQPKLCPEAFDSRMELPRGVGGACLLNGTQQIITPASASVVEQVMKAVMGQHIQEFKGSMDGSNDPPANMPYVLTMIGFRRLHNVQSLLEDAIFRNVPGDFMETGVWRGGVCLVAAAILQVYGQFPQRKVWLADSFRGLPPPTWEVDAQHHRGSEKMFFDDNSLQAVQATFRRYGFLSENIKWLPGFFNETLPKARSQYTSFAVLRFDGDLYQSVYESFENLYPFLSPGGYVIIDDFFDWYGSWKATMTYIKEQRIKARIHAVYHGKGEVVRGAWFQKPY